MSMCIYQGESSRRTSSIIIIVTGNLIGSRSILPIEVPPSSSRVRQQLLHFSIFCYYPINRTAAMYSEVALLALVSAVSALPQVSAYAGSVSSSQAPSTTSAPATSSATTFACNPAHSYPDGVSCISTAGSLTLVSPSASATTTTYACNPAHSYPDGVSCISTAGSLTLMSPSASATASSTTASSATASSSSACKTQYDACAYAPDANQATCAAEYSNCLGYNPFASNDANTTNSTASLVTPASTSSAVPSSSSACKTQYDACAYAPDANQATCAAEYSNCLGYNPFASNDANTTNSTASHATAASTSSSSAPPSSSSACKTQYDACAYAPDANQATCAAEYSNCLGYNPFASNDASTTTSTAQYTTYTTVTPCPVTKTLNGKTSTVFTSSTIVVTSLKSSTTKPAASAPASQTSQYSQSTPSNGQSLGTCAPIQTVTVQAGTAQYICPSQATMTVTQTVYASMSSRPSSGFYPSSSWGKTGGSAKPTGYHP